MTVQTLRHAVSLLPSCGTTGIGSLPHTQLELGLQMALQADIPFLPQLPTGHPAELMVPAALEGLPGLSFDAEGTCTVDLAAWRAEMGPFGIKLEEAFSRPEVLREFEPSPEACRAFRPFLWEVEHRRLALAKVQLAGPFTVRWVAKTSEGLPLAEVPELDQQVFRLILVRCLAMVRSLRQTHATPLIFLDEPGLYAFDARNPRHMMAMQELRLLTTALQREGALVGLHCCGNTDWAQVLRLGLNLISMDVRLSLDAVLEEREAVAAFLAEGGNFALGVVPTNLSASYDVKELTEAVETSLAATLGKSGRELLAHALLAPACGLAMRTVVDAERIFDELRMAKARLTAA